MTIDERVKQAVEGLRAPAYWMSGSKDGHEGENTMPIAAADLITDLHAECVASMETIARERERAEKAESWIKWVSDDVRRRIPEGQNQNQADSPFGVIGCMVLLTEERDALAAALRERPASYAAGIEDAARVAESSKCINCGAIFHPRDGHSDADCTKGWASWEYLPREDIAAAIRALAPKEAVKLETVERAAIKYDDIVIDVPKPGRHHHCFRLAEAFGKDPNDWIEQGFTTSTGRFVDRAEACRIASAAGQIVWKTDPDDVLFSEDVWPNSLPSQLLASHKGEREDGQHAVIGPYAVIDRGCISIRVPIDVLPNAFKYIPARYGLNDANGDPLYEVRDPAVFAKSVADRLNNESDDGTTAIHQMLDAAMAKAVEQGDEGVEEISRRFGSKP